MFQSYFPVNIQLIFPQTQLNISTLNDKLFKLNKKHTHVIPQLTVMAGILSHGMYYESAYTVAHFSQ